MPRAAIVLALCLLVSWRAQAQELIGAAATPTPAIYLPVVVNPLQNAATATPTRTATPTATNTPTATATRTATPTLPPASYNNCQSDPSAALAPNYPVAITGINKQAETVTLQNLSSSSIDLSGWIMCSITGNQQHPISGQLLPGQSVTFTNPSGPIWNNLSEDDGALYNPNGQLVSYRDA
ncbi:MAG: hypothetical protein Fur005_25880 [Roseiflexaceae bacterium]